MGHNWESGILADRQGWHGLGDVVTAEELAAMTDEQIVARAFPGPVEGMSWSVTDAPVMASAWGQDFPIEAQVAVLRDVAPHYLGMHGPGWKSRSPLENFQLGKAVFAGSPVECEISLNNGKTQVHLFRLGDDIRIGGSDVVRMYGLVSDSYDGSGKFLVGITCVRIVCQNTFNMALPGVMAKPHFTVKHTKHAEINVTKVQQALEMSFTWAEEFERTANLMANVDVTKRQFEQIISQAFPKGPSDRDRPFSNLQLGMIGNLESSPTITDDMRYTGWGAFNAVTEYLEHSKPRRNTTGDATLAGRALAERRLTDTLLSDQKEASKVASLILA